MPYTMRAVISKTKIFFLEGVLRPERPMDMVRLGTYYGGWWIPDTDASRGAALCVGAGFDVSFDRELSRLGFTVYTVDPTPESLEYLAEHEPDLTVVPIGVWSESGDIVFSRLSRKAHQAGIWTAGSTGHEARVMPVKTVRELMRMVGETTISILKLDIEGAEHIVTRSLIRDGVRPATLCIDFDDQRLRRVLRTVRGLRKYGYGLLQIDQWNYTFVDSRRAARAERPA